MKKILTLSMLLIISIWVTSCTSNNEVKKTNEVNKKIIKTNIVKKEDWIKIAVWGNALESSFKEKKQSINIQNVLWDNIEIPKKWEVTTQEMWWIQ